MSEPFIDFYTLGPTVLIMRRLKKKCTRNNFTICFFYAADPLILPYTDPPPSPPPDPKCESDPPYPPDFSVSAVPLPLPLPFPSRYHILSQLQNTVNTVTL